MLKYRISNDGNHSHGVWEYGYFRIDFRAGAGAGRYRSSLLVNMNTIFEDFVTVALTEALAPYGGRCAAQNRQHTLDDARLIKLRPDLVRYSSAGRPIAVVDAKYKSQSPAGYPHADLYQLLAYCTALQLAVGHLVYAEGEFRSANHRITHAQITIAQHTLNLHQPVPALLDQIDQLAFDIAEATKITPPFVR